MKIGIVLVGHGNRKQFANEELLQVAELLSQNDEYQVIQPAYLELADPDIPTGIDLCIEKGAERVIVVPYFLLAGSHVKEDLPQFIEDATSRHTGVSIRLVEALGYHPVLADIILDRIDAVLSLDEQESV